jgi:hypothetical protein
LDGVLMQAPDETGLIDFYQAHGFNGLVTSMSSKDQSSVPDSAGGLSEVGQLADTPLSQEVHPQHYDTPASH